MEEEKEKGLVDWERGMQIDTNLAFLLYVATAACNIAGLLGVFHGVGELGTILHVVARMLARAL